MSGCFAGKAKAVKKRQPATSPKSGSKRAKAARELTPSESNSKGNESEEPGSEEEAPKSRRALAEWSDDE